MSEFWDDAFLRSQLMWGLAPTASANIACDYFAKRPVADVLIPGIGYGRNAKPFLDQGMRVTGIEISETAISLARDKLGLDIPIHKGSVLDMPFDDRQYDAVFCFGLLYLLDAQGREQLLSACARQLVAGAPMVFTVISKEFDMYGKGVKLGDDWYETHPGVKMFFYDEASIRREFAPFGVVEVCKVDEPMGHGSTRPFLNVFCELPR
jgi:cyclopropane fatty-acyl-phospholipid synthase-like methyltransferase